MDILGVVPAGCLTLFTSLIWKNVCFQKLNPSRHAFTKKQTNKQKIPQVAETILKEMLQNYFHALTHPMKKFHCLYKM